MRFPPGAAVDPGALATGGQEVPVAGDGTFEVPDPVPGTWLLGVQREYAGPVVVTREVAYEGGSVETTLEVPPLARSLYVVLRVLGPDGAPLPDVQVTAGYESSRGSASGGTEAFDREEGVRWVVLAGRGQAPPDAVHWIEVHSPALGRRRVEVPSGPAPEATIRFERPASVEVAVTGLVGSAYEGRVRAHLVPRGVGAFLGRPEPLGADGRLTLRSVQPGAHDLVLSVARATRQDTEVARAALDVDDPSVSVTVPLPRLHRVVFEGARSPLWLTRPEVPGFHVHAPAGPDGRVVVDALPDGEYRVQGTEHQETFTLPGATTIRLR
jgi:hypothetical protein